MKLRTKKILKLLKVGYTMNLENKNYKLKRVVFDYKTYAKTYNGYDCEVVVCDKKIISKRVVVNSVCNQKELDNIQIALNNLERDVNGL